MKFISVLLASFFIVSVAAADQPCANAASAAGNSAGGQTSCSKPAVQGAGETPALPESAQAGVDKLRVDLRYMRATGHPVEAEKKKESIAAIYQEHGVALPADFAGW